MSIDTHAIHHVTAIASDPQQNIDFYAGVLGLRLVKLTVNFDDPGAYHLYYGDRAGNPGTIMTFFAWPGAPRGHTGSAQVAVTTFAIPPPALDFWRERLAQHGVDVQEMVERVGAATIAFRDPDGLMLELAADQTIDHTPGWADGPVPKEYAIRGIHGVTLWVSSSAPTGALLTDVLGFREVDRDFGIARYTTEHDGPGAVVHLREHMDRPGTIAVGSVHHVAFQVPDDQTQLTMRERLESIGYSVTPVRDRTYFRSIYFVEPGGVLFEMATNPPGFTVDETEAELGTRLKLPDWLESRRALVERALPRIVLPAAGAWSPL